MSSSSQSALSVPRVAHGMFPPPSLAAHTALFAVHWGRSGAVVSVAGELDAANAPQLVEYVQRCAANCEWLVLDLTELQFMGTAGFSALHRINSLCGGSQVQWAVVPGAVASRLLQICNPDTVLPVAESVALGLAKVQGTRSLALQLVSQPR